MSSKRKRCLTHKDKNANRTSQVLHTKRRFRSRASPETIKIRNIVEVPMQRRFLKACEDKESKLFGTIPPRRLNEAVFALAAQEPLESIFTRHATALKHVPGGKVVKICKWKIRKMRYVLLMWLLTLFTLTHLLT